MKSQLLQIADKFYYFSILFPVSVYWTNGN